MLDGFPLLFIIVIIWLCIGLPLSKVSQAKKKSTPGRPVSDRPAETTPEPPQKTAVQDAPAVRETRLAPTVTVTLGDDSVYRGSMNAVTGEGYDPCHDEDLAGLNSAETAAPVHPAGDMPALPFGWTGSDMVRGIVVSEILNRKQGLRR